MQVTYASKTNTFIETRSDVQFLEIGVGEGNWMNTGTSLRLLVIR